MSLSALWAFAAVITIPPAIDDYENGRAAAQGSAAFDPLASALPQERQETYLWQLSGGKPAGASLVTSRQATDAAIQTMVTGFKAQQPSFDVDTRREYGLLITQLGQIGTIRQQVDAGTISATAAFSRYDDIVDQLFTFVITDSQHFYNPLIAVDAGALDLYEQLDMASREVTLINGAFAHGGQLTPAARTLFVAAATERAGLGQQAEALVPSSIPLLATDTPAFRRFVSLENQIVNSTGSRVPVQAPVWGAATGAFMAQAREQGNINPVVLAKRSASYGESLTIQAVLAGGVGLLAVIVSVLALVWFGRRVTGDLASLNGHVRRMADERLPRVVERLRKGEEVDVSAESPLPDDSSIREIKDIVESFATVQGAAVAAAVDQARLRKGVSQLFLNISMRNQSLLHRQLGMLDTMERRTNDPKALAELFRLDHLTTRMRRHAEGLIILAGSTPGRGWREPVLAVDVLRAAVAEIEDYVRVDVTSESRDMILGNAVNDIIHLVAELVENATLFSPPHTRVEVRAERVGTGLVAEIEDRGLGLSEPERAAINARLDAPPELDFAASGQLGLFIVGQLASRHGIKVSLRASAYGGITAIVRLPFSLIVREEDVPASDGPGRGKPPALRSAGGPVPEAGPPAAMADRQEVAGRHRLPTTATGRAFAGGSAADVSPKPGAPAFLPWPTSPDAVRAPAPAAPGGTHLGMPIRIPQASLAPQLHDRPAAPPAEHAVEAEQRTPEQTRQLMNLMQQGWQRGRADDLDDPAFRPSDDRTDR